MRIVKNCGAGQEICTLLQVATFGSIIACLLRHFRSSLASLPLLSQPVGSLPIGTWSPASRQAQQEEGTMPEVMSCTHPMTAGLLICEQGLLACLFACLLECLHAQAVRLTE